MPRFSREDWADHGLEQLSARGPSALGIEAIERSSGRTRGSLYHHFASHAGFLVAVLERWATRHCDEVIAAVNAEPHDPAAHLNHLAVSLDFALEREVRRLAETRPALLEIVARVDGTRIDFLEQLHADTADPRAIAELEYAAYVGAQHLQGVLTPERLEVLNRIFVRLISE